MHLPDGHTIELVVAAVTVGGFILRELGFVPQRFKKSIHSYTPEDRTRDYAMHEIICGNKKLGVDNINKVLRDIRKNTKRSNP